MKFKATIHYSKVVEAENEEDAMAQIVEMWREEVENADEQDYIEVEKVKEEQQYQCLICKPPVIFDTKTGKGKMHMAGHGYSLEGALQLGKARVVR